jgi:hypothetical protein
MLSTDLDKIREDVFRKCVKDEFDLNEDQVNKALFRFKRLVEEGHAEDYSYVETMKRYNVKA